MKIIEVLRFIQYTNGQKREKKFGKLHGEAFFSSFDAAFNLKTIGCPSVKQAARSGANPPGHITTFGNLNPPIIPDVVTTIFGEGHASRPS